LCRPDKLHVEIASLNKRGRLRKRSGSHAPAALSNSAGCRRETQTSLRAAGVVEPS